MDSLDGQQALVTGGGRGFGRGIVESTTVLKGLAARRGGERLFAIGAERTPQLSGDPGHRVRKRPSVGDGRGVTAGGAVSSSKSENDPR